jgi:erythromycin esterase-like protein
MTRTLIDEYGDTGIVQDPDHPVVRAVTEACEARIRDIKRDVRRAAREEMCAATPREVKRLVTLGRAHLAGRSRDGSTHWDGCELEHVWCLLDRVVGALVSERDALRAENAAWHDVIQQLFALVDPEHDPALTERVHAMLGADSERCANAICQELEDLRAEVERLQRTTCTR